MHTKNVCGFVCLFVQNQFEDLNEYNFSKMILKNKITINLPNSAHIVLQIIIPRGRNV